MGTQPRSRLRPLSWPFHRGGRAPPAHPAEERQHPKPGECGDDCAPARSASASTFLSGQV